MTDSAFLPQLISLTHIKLFLSFLKFIKLASFWKTVQRYISSAISFLSFSMKHCNFSIPFRLIPLSFNFFIISISNQLKLSIPSIIDFSSPP